METTRFLKIVIIILLLINTGTLLFIWTQGSHHAPPPPPRESVFDFLTRELQLDKQQQEQYEQLRDEHHQAVENLQENSRKLHRQYFELLNVSAVDSMKVNSMADSMASVQKQIELVTFYHFRQVRSICRPEQQKKFDEVIDEALRMMAPPPPPGRR